MSRKYIKNGYPLVDLELWAENQRGEVTAPGLATVVLPAKNAATKVFMDGSALQLELPTVR